MPVIVDEWKSRVMDMYRSRYGEKLDEKKLEKKLNLIIKERFKDPKATLVNNYVNKCVRCNISAISNLVMSKEAILGGDGCLFLTHDKARNILVEIILDLMAKRKLAKKERSKYSEGSDMYRYWDLKQLNIKIKINSLYGIMGYKGFHLFNVNLAQSVTAGGQNIISTAACGYENFIADNIHFVCAEEVENYLRNIHMLYVNGKEENQWIYDTVPFVSLEKAAARLRSKMNFQPTTTEGKWIISILEAMTDDELKLVYYKNNLDDFNKTPVMRDILRKLFDGIDTLTLGDLFAFEAPEKTGTICDPETLTRMKILIAYYRAMVVYPFPVYDRVRRTKYTQKKAILYIDTDSNFISLSKFVRFINHEIYNDAYVPAVTRLNTPEDAFKVFYGKDSPYDKMKLKIVSVYTMILSDVVAYNFEKFTDSLNIEPEWGKKLGMKNECYFPRMAFGRAKKRYIGFLMIREGNVIENYDSKYPGINGGYGVPQIAGYDFIKAGTKASIREKYTYLTLKMLLPSILDARQLFKEVFEFKDFIKSEVRNGKSEYFKQGTANILTRYKDPYRIQAIKGVILWNALAVEPLELPVEVDIVPSKLYAGYSDKRLDKFRGYGSRPSETTTLEELMEIKMPILAKFAFEFPDEYEKLYKEIINNPNEKIRRMELNALSKPRALPSEELPKWFAMIIDDDKIINDAVSLVNPLFESTGALVMKTGTQTSHFTNLIQI